MGFRQKVLQTKIKQKFINILSTKLVEKSCKMYHASGDADLLIVQKLVESVPAVNTALIVVMIPIC